MGTRPCRAWLRLAAILAVVSAAPVASAQNLYLEGSFGGSQALVDTRPDLTVANTTIGEDEDDQDRSIVGGGAMGFRFPLSWALDRELPRSMPDVHFRIEEEASAGREYDLFTKNGFRSGPGDAEFRTNLEMTSVMTNLWIEVPIYRAWSFVGGAGLGFAMTQANVKNSFASLGGDEDEIVFAWQAGAGFEYSFDDTVTMGLGYRYFKPDKVKVNVDQLAPVSPAGEFEVEPEAHEFLIRMRVDFYSF